MLGCNVGVHSLRNYLLLRQHYKPFRQHGTIFDLTETGRFIKQKIWSLVCGLRYCSFSYEII